MNKLQKAFGIGTLILALSGCGKETPLSPQANSNTETPKKISIEERLAGFYTLNLEQPVEYNDNLINTIAGYSMKNEDIGVFPIVENGRVTGFGVYATKIGAGYTRMNDDILNLAK